MSNFTEVKTNHGIDRGEGARPIIEPGAPHQDGCVHIDGLTGEAQYTRTMMVNSSQIDNRQAVRFFSPNGASRITDASSLTDECMVDVGRGVMTDIGTAKRMGLISQKDIDNWGSNTKAEPQAQPEAEPQQAVNFADGEVSEILKGMKTVLGSNYADTLMFKCLAHTFNSETQSDGGSERGQTAINELASALKVSPEEAGDAVEVIINTIHARATAYAQRAYGVDGRGLFRWASEKLQPEVYTQILQRLYLNDVSVIPELIQRKKLGNRY
jgi:hypothetical protein